MHTHILTRLQHDYLIHAMLGLAASELIQLNHRTLPDRDLQHASIHHRSRAMSSLNRATQRGITTSEEGNAMLATVMTLLAQSPFLADGLLEYLSLIRGTKVISEQMYKQRLTILFTNGTPPVKHGGQVSYKPLLDPQVTRAGVRSFETVFALCQTRLQIKVCKILMKTARSLQQLDAQCRSPCFHCRHYCLQTTNGFTIASIELFRVYALGNFVHCMTQVEFNDFISPSSPNAQTHKILQAHFVALLLVMYSATSFAAIGKAESAIEELERTPTVGWLTAVHATIKESNKEYMTWTRFIEEEVLAGRFVGGADTSTNGHVYEETESEGRLEQSVR